MPIDKEYQKFRTVDGKIAIAVTGAAAAGGSIPINLASSDGFGSGNSIGVSCAGYSLQAYFEAIDDWVESDGADGIAVNVNHRGVGTKSLEFDKVAGDTTAMISREIPSFDMSAYSTHAIGHMYTYVSDLTNVDYVFVRMGTDSSNYWEWRFSADLMTDGWNDLNTPITSPTSQTGNGMNLAAACWMAFGVEFDGAANTLDDIRTSGWAVKRVLETTQIVSADVQLNSPFLVIKDRNSNNKLDIAKGGSYNYLYNRNTDGTNLMPAGDADARAIYVNLGSNNDVTVTGTVTANAGTGTQAVSLASVPSHAVTNAGTFAIQSTNTSLIGDGDPTIDSYSHAAINLSAGADQVLVASSASKQIWVYGISFTCSVAGTVSFQTEDNVAVTGIMDFYANSGLGIPPSGNFSMPIWKLPTNKDLEVDIVDCAVDGWLDYAIVSV